jgi:hypothetical protein
VTIQIPVEADSPSARTSPYVVMDNGAIVAWHTERGWMCEAHQIQPCEHTADLVVTKNPEWNQ